MKRVGQSVSRPESCAYAKATCAIAMSTDMDAETRTPTVRASEVLMSEARPLLPAVVSGGVAGSIGDAENERWRTCRLVRPRAGGVSAGSGLAAGMHGETEAAATARRRRSPTNNAGFRLWDDEKQLEELFLDASQYPPPHGPRHDRRRLA